MMTFDVLFVPLLHSHLHPFHDMQGDRENAAD